MAANAMFAEALVSISAKHRASPAHFFSEIIATLGLLLVIFSIARTKRDAAAPDAVGAYIGAAYFFTSSTSFANPAISIGRMFSNTFAGIAPASSRSRFAASGGWEELDLVFANEVGRPTTADRLRWNFQRYARARQPSPDPLP